MLKRILASMAITSVLLALVLLVYWWRSNHGHRDQFTLGKGANTESHFTTQNGRIMLEVTDHISNGISSRIQFFDFKNIIGFCLLIPGLWLAIKIRSLLPRPPGRGLRNRGEELLR